MSKSWNGGGKTLEIGGVGLRGGLLFFCAEFGGLEVLGWRCHCAEEYGTLKTDRMLLEEGCVLGLRSGGFAMRQLD